MVFPGFVSIHSGNVGGSINSMGLFSAFVQLQWFINSSADKEYPVSRLTAKPTQSHR